MLFRLRFFEKCERINPFLVESSKKSSTCRLVTISDALTAGLS